MVSSMFSLVIAYLCTYSSIKLLKPVALRIDLVDRPNSRKLHNGAVPLVGGISVFLGLCAGLLVVEQPFQHSTLLYVIASAGMVTIGVIDDKRDLRVSTRIWGQLLAASIMVFACGQSISEVGNLFGQGSISLGVLSVPFTYLAVLGAINAFNMVDGIDGLIGGLTISSVMSMSILFLLANQSSQAMFCLILAFAILPYLLFNLCRADHPKKRKIFMGDAGSMFIGLTVVWLLCIGSQGDTAAFSPVTALWIISLPLIDMVGVMLRRVRKGQSPFLADRDHLHHIFLRAGFNSKQTLTVITLASVALGLVGIALQITGAPESVSFVAFIAVFAMYSYGHKHIWQVLKVVRKIDAVKRLRRQNRIQYR